MQLYSRHLAQNCGFKGSGRRSVGLSCESGLGVEHIARLVSRCLQGCRAAGHLLPWRTELCRGEAGREAVRVFLDARSP